MKSTFLAFAFVLSACSHEKNGFVNLARVPNEPKEAKTKHQLIREKDHNALFQQQELMKDENHE